MFLFQFQTWANVGDGVVSWQIPNPLSKDLTGSPWFCWHPSPGVASVVGQALSAATVFELFLLSRLPRDPQPPVWATVTLRLNESPRRGPSPRSGPALLCAHRCLHSLGSFQRLHRR
jgi:hypothetical protein